MAAKKQQVPASLVRGAIPRARAWLDSRRLIYGTTLTEKMIQLQKRLGRIESYTYLRQPERVVSAVADAAILLTAISEQIGLPLEDCLRHRLEVLRYRDGEIVKGRWIPYRETPP